MPDKLVSQDPTNPGVLKINGANLSAIGQILLNGLDVTGANPNDVVTLSGGVWTHAAPSSASYTAANVGAGTGLIFKTLSGTQFQFKSLIAGTNITLSNNASDITINATTTGIFTKSFTSTDQTITAGGTLTLAHGLGAAPFWATVSLVCQVNELGYTAGQEVLSRFGTTGSTAGNEGVGCVPDATNLNIIMGSGASLVDLNNFTTGVSGAITNAKWKLRFRAWL